MFQQGICGPTGGSVDVHFALGFDAIWSGLQTRSDINGSFGPLHRYMNGPCASLRITVWQCFLGQLLRNLVIGCPAQTTTR